MTVRLPGSGAVCQAAGSQVRMKLEGSLPAAQLAVLEGLEPLPGVSNYYAGPAPVLVAPRSGSSVKEGKVTIAWSEVEAGWRSSWLPSYQYAVFRESEIAPIAEGVTRGTYVVGPLPASETGSRYRARVRACLGPQCVLGAADAPGA